METGPVMYTLDARQLEQARAILQREQQANTLSARQEKIFKLLNFAFYGLGIAWLANLLLRGMTIADSSALVAAGRAVFRVVLVINTLTYTLAAAITTLFFLNLPYLRRLLRQRQLARQVGLWAALCAPWRAERRRNQLRHALDVGIVTVGLLMVAGSVLGAVVAIPLASYDWVPLSLCLLLFVASGVIVATYFMRCSQERLGLLSRLHSSLEGDQEEVRQDQDRQIHIPPEAYEKIAEIERAQICATGCRASSATGSNWVPPPTSCRRVTRHSRRSATRRDHTPARAGSDRRAASGPAPRRYRGKSGNWCFPATRSRDPCRHRLYGG